MFYCPKDRRTVQSSRWDGAIFFIIPGTSCLATIVLSLRDKIHSTAEALHHSLTWCTSSNIPPLISLFTLPTAIHVGPWGRGLGENIYISFDPDGTVGTIHWIKLDGDAFSEAEIQQRLRVASHVSWQRRTDHDTGELNWVGVQNGRVIFDANEADNGQGAYILSISTR